MKNALLLTLFVGIAVFGVTQNETNRGYKIKIGDQLPDLEMEMRNGEVWISLKLESKPIQSSNF